MWRRVRDSNPWKSCDFNGFQDRRIRPLCQLSRRIITHFIFSSKQTVFCVSLCLMIYQTFNPSTEALENTYPVMSKVMLQNGLDNLTNTFALWSNFSLEQRKSIVLKLPSILTRHAHRYASLIASEMGKPISQGIAEINKCANLCHFYAQRIDRYLAPTPLTERAFVYHQPMGIILGVMPWNFPFWQVFRFCIPTLLAGNVVLLKHAPNVPQCALEIESLFQKACPENAPYLSAFLTHEDTSQLIAHPSIKGLSFTGSSNVGALLAQKAASFYKPFVLECGGSDPFIVCEDAQIDKAVDAAIKSRFINSGQTCISAKRFFVQKSIYSVFVSQLKEKILSLKVGDPLDAGTDIGPLARKDLLETLERQFRESITKGATVVAQGLKKPPKGYYFSPCLLSHDHSNMPVCIEETFGPLAVISSFDSVEEVIQTANKTPFGLGASFWSRDETSIQYAVQKLETGNVFINDFVHSIPDIPFGGVKSSGFGKELGKEGVTSFCYNKSIVIK